MDDTPPAATLAKLARAMRILAMDGHDDITLGHMSIRDEAGRGVWLKKSQRGIDEVWSKDDFVLIDWNGAVIQNDGPRHSEWPIHTQILKIRPDLNVIGHTHARYAVLFSAANEELSALNHEGANLVGQISRYNGTAGLINTVRLGDDVASNLGQNSLSILKNHGIVFTGATIEEATLNGLFLERACKMQVIMASTGWDWTAPSAIGHDRKMGETRDAASGYHKTFFDYFDRRLLRSELSQAAGRST